MGTWASYKQGRRHYFGVGAYEVATWLNSRLNVW